MSKIGLTQGTTAAGLKTSLTRKGAKAKGRGANDKVFRVGYTENLQSDQYDTEQCSICPVLFVLSHLSGCKRLAQGGICLVTRNTVTLAEICGNLRNIERILCTHGPRLMSRFQLARRPFSTQCLARQMFWQDIDNFKSQRKERPCNQPHSDLGTYIELSCAWQAESDNWRKRPVSQGGQRA